MEAPIITEYVQQLLSILSNERQINYWQLFLDKAEAFDIKTLNQDRETLQMYCRINRPKLKACYKNSLLLAIACEEIQYVEGYVYCQDLPISIEHAWNTNQDRYIIDTTAQLWNTASSDEYLGVVIPKKILLKYLNTDQRLTALQFYLTNYNKEK